MYSLSQQVAALERKAAVAADEVRDFARGALEAGDEVRALRAFLATHNLLDRYDIQRAQERAEEANARSRATRERARNPEFGHPAAPSSRTEGPNGG